MIAWFLKVSETSGPDMKNLTIPVLSGVIFSSNTLLSFAGILQMMT